MSVHGSAPRRRGSLVEEFSTRELSIDRVADERFGRLTGRLEPRDKGRFRRLSNPAGRNVSEA